MSKDEFTLPEPKPVIRNGESLLQLTHGGEVVGEINFSKILKNWWGELTGQSKKHLELIP